ncbi:mediator of RNA polymerase II transcription subunit 15 [Biomphalaria glabrata]|nr:mediator of RNA polymerase II transcription subunit 15 [Biomphalaria glabrata]
MFAIENNLSLPSTSSSPQDVPVVSSLVSDSVFAMEDNFLLPSASSPEEVSVVSSLVCDSVFTMEDNFLLPTTSAPQEVPKNTKKPNRKRKSASSSKGKAKKKKDASLGEGGNSSGEHQIVSPLACSVFSMEDNFSLPSTSSSQQEVPENKTKQKAKTKIFQRKGKKKKEANLGNGENISSEHQVLCCLTFDSVLNMEDNCVFPATSPQEVPDNKIKQPAKPKSSKGKARTKKGENTPEDPYARVKRSKRKKSSKSNREAIDELKQMDIPDFLSVDNYKVGCKCHTLKNCHRLHRSHDESDRESRPDSRRI